MFNIIPLVLAAVVGSTLSFSPAKTNVAVGEEFKVAVYASSNIVNTLGTDAVISYDPKILKATKIKPGKIYPIYPENLQDIDNVHGKLSFSGTVGFDKPKPIDGLLGEVYFRAQKKGTTEIGFNWQKDTTNNSNIVPDSGILNLLDKKPEDITLSVYEPWFLQKIFLKLSYLLSFEYLQF